MRKRTFELCYSQHLAQSPFVFSVLSEARCRLLCAWTRLDVGWRRKLLMVLPEPTMGEREEVGNFWKACHVTRSISAATHHSLAIRKDTGIA